MAWLQKYKPEEMCIEGDLASRLAAGNEVGDLAMGIFSDYVEVTAYKGEKLDLPKMIDNTRIEMSKGTPVICEASFVYDGLYCAVDILRRENGGWAIYEVKSSTHDDKDVYYADVAYQKYVLEHCGVNVTGTYLICLNGQYVFNGELKLDELFRITDVSESIKCESDQIEVLIESAEVMLESDREPELDLSARCRSPYWCGFRGYCFRHLPKPSVFDLYRLKFDKKLAFYKQGLASFEALEHSVFIKNEKQRRQIDFALHERGTYIDRQSIRKFLNKLSYPLYFLDFETVQPVIPKYIGTKPYAQIPFQYSLHYIERDGGELLHKEFLAEPGTDPRRTIAERLCEDIPMNVCITAYNKDFECTRIKELAETFPDLSEHLLNIRDHIVDLIEPFRSGWYYNRAMGGSFSIKSVLPAIFSDDPSLDYHNLEGIHNGGEAMNAFPAMEKMTAEEREATRRNLLKYCELDTYAMVKVWEELRRVTE
ncbi:MAG: DUF2779 domain-containing protein [Clostridiales bacterium]|nr:DUF2779 domain-containing protein [Clostridiales bacterium]